MPVILHTVVLTGIIWHTQKHRVLYVTSVSDIDNCVKLSIKYSHNVSILFILTILYIIIIDLSIVFMICNDLITEGNIYVIHKIAGYLVSIDIDDRTKIAL